MKVDSEFNSPDSSVLLLELMLGFIQGTLDTYLSLLQAVVEGNFKNVVFNEADKQQTYRYIEQLQQAMAEQANILETRKEKLPSILATTEQQLSKFLDDKNNPSADEKTTLNTMAVVLNLVKSGKQP